MTNSEASRQIQRRFRVRRGHVQAWLAYLIVNHPHYQTVTTDPTQLAQLPEDGSIIDDVPTVLDDDADGNNENKEDQGQPTESEQSVEVYGQKAPLFLRNLHICHRFEPARRPLQWRPVQRDHRASTFHGVWSPHHRRRQAMLIG